MSTGIRATSASNPMTSGETTDGNRAGYVTQEQVTLSLTGVTPAAYAWSLSVPPTSDTALDSAIIASPKFIPDIAGDYLVQLDADGDVYTFILGTANVARMTLISVAKFPPVLESTVPDPLRGSVHVFNSLDRDELVEVDDAGTVMPLGGPRLAGMVRKVVTTGSITGAPSDVISTSVTLAANELSDVWFELSCIIRATALTLGATLVPIMNWKGIGQGGSTGTCLVYVTDPTGPVMGASAGFSAVCVPGTTGPAATVGANTIALGAMVSGGTGTVSYAEIVIKQWLGKPPVLTVS